MSQFKQYARWIVGSVLLASALGVGALGIAGVSRDSGFGFGHDREGGYSEDHDSRDDASGDRRSRDADDDDSSYDSGSSSRAALAGGGRSGQGRLRSLTPAVSARVVAFGGLQGDHARA